MSLVIKYIKDTVFLPSCTVLNEGPSYGICIKGGAVVGRHMVFVLKEGPSWAVIWYLY